MNGYERFNISCQQYIKKKKKLAVSLDDLYIKSHEQHQNTTKHLHCSKQRLSRLRSLECRALTW
jgi:hypothetical protein